MNPDDELEKRSRVRRYGRGTDSRLLADNHYAPTWVEVKAAIDARDERIAELEGARDERAELADAMTECADEERLRAEKAEAERDRLRTWAELSAMPALLWAREHWAGNPEAANYSTLADLAIAALREER